MPSSWPGYHASNTPATDDSHGIVTAEPVLSTTIVCGLAAATAEISELLALDRSMFDRSLPSLSKLLTNTTATFAAAAAVAAELVDDPLLYVTVTPLPARDVMPVSGVTVPLELTPALPPPSDCTLVEASAPMTAIECVDDVSGSRPALFFSSTVPSSASCRADGDVRGRRRGLGRRPDRRLVEHAEREQLGQDPADAMPSSVALRDLTGRDRAGQRAAVEAVVAGHVLVETGVGGRDRGVRRAPVGGDEAGEAELRRSGRR